MNILRKYKDSEFFKSVTILVSGNFVSQVVSLSTIPIISRLYSENDFGEAAIFFSTASIIVSISAAGLASAIMSPKDEKKAKDVFFTAFSIQQIIFTIFFIICILLSPRMKLYRISIPYIGVCVLTYIYLVTYGLNSLLSIYANRQGKNRILFINALIGSFSTLLITVPLGILGSGTIGFILAAIIASVIMSAQMLIRVNPFYRILSYREMVSIIIEFKDYILYQFPANLISSFSIQLPNQLLSRHFGNVALGSFAMCERVMGYPTRLIAAPITTIYFRHATKYIHEGRNLGAFTYSLIKRMLLIIFIPITIFSIFSENVFVFVLGEKWKTAGFIAAILSIQYLMKFCNQCLSYNLVVLNKQINNLLLSIIQVVIITISLSCGILIFNNLLSTIICFAIGNTMVESITLAVQLYYLKLKVSSFGPKLVLYIFLLVTLIWTIRAIIY